MNFKRLLPAVAVLGLFATLPVQALTIDDFTTGGFTLNLTNFAPAALPVNAVDNSPGIGVLGGTRTTTFTRTAGVNGVAATAAVGLLPDVFTLDLGPGSEGNVAMVYDGINNLDISTLGSFLLDFTVVNGNSTINIIVDSDGNTSTASLVGVSGGVNGIALTDFVGTADFTMVDSIRLEVFGGDAADLRLESFSIAPEPGALLMFGSGLLAVGWMRRRKTTR